MKIATLVLLGAAALPALAQSPANFRSNAAITPGGKDPLQVIELPYEAYRDARRDLADIRIYNGSGDSLPFAWAPDPGRLVEPATPFDLPYFPVRKLPPAGQPTTEVTVRAADGTLVSIKGLKPGPGTGQAPVPGTGQAPVPGTGQAPVPGLRQPSRKSAGPPAAAWLADASKANEPIAAVVLDWQQVPGTEMFTARVEGSDDLKTWHTLGSAPMIRLSTSTGGRGLVQPRIEFAPRNVKYLRVTTDAPAFEPTAIRAEYAPRGKAPPRHVRTVEAKRAEGSDEITFDLGAWLPVEAIRLIPQQDNAILVGTIQASDELSEPWRPLFTATFYRLQREGVESMSPPRELGGRRAARYWMVRMAPGSSAGPLPKLEVHWTPARLVFVKEGEGPYYFAFGNLNGRPTALAIESVIPDYKRGAEEILPRAKLGDVVAGPPPNRFDKLIGEMDARRVALWAVLIAGVIALGVMAHRLSRQVK